MVKLYLNNIDPKKKNSVQYIDVSMWSLFKAYILSYLMLTGFIIGGAIILGIFIGLMMGG
jgi:hypothetical protein